MCNAEAEQQQHLRRKKLHCTRADKLVSIFSNLKLLTTSKSAGYREGEASWQGLDAKEGEGVEEEDSDSQDSSSEEGDEESEDPMEGSSSDDDGDGGLENAENEEENGMGDGEQFGGKEEEMGGEPRSEEREESGVQAGPAQHSSARRPSCKLIALARFA
jgi:hypothetical protein